MGDAAVEDSGKSGRAADPLVAMLYDDLRAIAASYCLPGTSGTIQPTVVVHEAYLKLAGFEARTPRTDGPADAGPVWQDREHFLAVAATAMRQVLVDYARRRRSVKRAGSGEGARVDLDLAAAGQGAASGSPMVDVVELDDALRGLEAVDPRAARVVELRYFAGMTVEETGRTLGLGRTSVEASWRVARAWLLSQMHPEGCGDRQDGTGDQP